jgi:hypothetical protein
MRAIRLHSGVHGIENFDRRSAGVRRGLPQERRDGSDERRLGRTRFSVTSDMAGYLATPYRVADEGNVHRIEGLDQASRISEEQSALS